MRVGFTGTRRGTTPEQHKALCEWIKAHAETITELHHGCCVGADMEAEEAFGVWAPKAVRHAHPSTLRSWTSWTAMEGSHVRHERKLPLDRNRDIVDACDVLVACPKQELHSEITGGTGHAVHYAERVGRPLVIVWPDGVVEEYPTPESVR